MISVRRHVKWLHFYPDGKLAGTEAAEYSVYYPQEGWAEQNPREWWEVVCTAIKKLLENNVISPSKIIAVGIDGQSWAAIPVTAAGKMLCNTPIWTDTRAQSICEEIRAE